MDDSAGRTFGYARRWTIGLVALVTALGVTSHAVASDGDVPRAAPGLPPSASASDAPLSYAQAREWIAAPRGRYGSDPQSPGPSVKVNVPNAGGGMGFIEVWARVRANANQTAVGLFDITGGNKTFVDGQDTLCSQTVNVPIPGDLFLTLDGFPGIYGTPMVLCAPNTGAPGSVLLRVPAGKRRFKLEYVDCGCTDRRARVSHRWLWIRPVPAS